MKFPSGQYGVIYVDPPWKYEMWSDAGHAKGPHAHYSGMTFDQLAAMRDQILFATAPDAVMIMWTTWAADDNRDMLQQSLDLMRLWGFRRKSGGSWSKTTKHGKQNFGPGYIFRSADEILILGTVGNPRIKNHSTRNHFYTGDIPDNLNDLAISLHSPRREHSRKPDEMIPLIENLFDGPYLELFARAQRPGWTAWGNQTEKFQEEKHV